MVDDVINFNIKFLSTPSARRATCTASGWSRNMEISIHALREEGDARVLNKVGGSSISIHALREEGDARRRAGGRGFAISIHALREEGDGFSSMYLSIASYFYPRPPRGGRPAGFVLLQTGLEISIHALREEGDCRRLCGQLSTTISIHALREEGDNLLSTLPLYYF